MKSVMSKEIELVSSRDCFEDRGDGESWPRIVWVGGWVGGWVGHWVIRRWSKKYISTKAPFSSQGLCGLQTRLVEPLSLVFGSGWARRVSEGREWMQGKTRRQTHILYP